MPFCDLPADKVSLYYKANTPSGDVSTLNPDKATIIMLHALFLDSSFLPQYSDPRLADYNIIAIDFRSSGRTKAPVSALHDTNVLAADIAFFHDLLKLPPCHIFAGQNSAINTSLRLALLWPEKVLSLTLCGLPSPTDEEWVAKAYNELMTLWSFAPDLETFEEAIVELSYFMFNSDIPPDLADEVAAHWQIHFAPCHRTRTFDIGAVVFGRVPLTPEELAQIKQPVLILQGERSAVYPVVHAEKFHEQLVNADGGAKLVVIKGGPDCLSILPAFTGRIGKIFSEFLSRLPPPPPPASIPQKKTKERMRAALARQAELTGDNKYLSREWRSSLSFSRVTPEAKAATEQALAFFGQGEKQALSCLGKNGQPIRKFSERHHSQWFGAGQTIVRSSSVSDNGHHIEPNSSIKA